MATKQAAQIRRELYSIMGCCISKKAVFRTISPIHPLTFKPEFINAFELGSKNTMPDGTLTLNGRCLLL